MKLIKQDYELLSLLNHCRYITTKQIVRLYFPNNTLKTATRRANLFTKKLSPTLNGELEVYVLGVARIFGI